MAVHLSPTPELLLNRCWLWQVVSSGRAASTKVLTNPPRRHRPYRFAVGWVAQPLLVQDGILMLPELVNHRLYPQHQELVPQMQSELQVILGATKEGPDSLAGLDFHKSPQWTPHCHFSHCPTTCPVENSSERLQAPEFPERVGGDIL